MGLLELQSYAAGILDNSPAVQDVYITLFKCVLLEPARAGFYLWGLLCQLLDEFAAVEAAVEVSHSDRRWMQLHCIFC